MKKIIINEAQEIKLDELNISGPQIVVYRSISRVDREDICILHRVNVDNYPTRYGFINTGYHSNKPTFVGNSIEDSINLAITTGRKVYLFDSFNHLVDAIKEKKI